MKRRALNFFAFHAGWYACARTASWVGAGVVGLLVVPQLALAPDRRRLLRVLLASALFGLLADTALERMGLVAYAGGPRLGVSCPLWIVALWVNFATTLTGVLDWLPRRPVAAALLGAAAGPLAYVAGEALGAVDAGTPGYVAVALEYALAVPLLGRVARA